MNRALNFLHLTTFYAPSSFGGDAVHPRGKAPAAGLALHRPARPGKLQIDLIFDIGCGM
jgi:hypothetical protein